MANNQFITRITATLAALLCSVAAAAVPGEIAYQPIEGAMPVPITAGAGLRSKQDLETFLDGVMADQLDSHRLSGATVAVVKDGALFFVKGYGHADREKQIPMSGKNSIIRPGSVSKLLTWTALMQLVERGQIDLDTDLNEYLTSFNLPDTFDAPITARNILTHTAGLEDGALGYLMAEGPEGLQPMAEFLELHMPERVRPPTTDFSDGSNASYSNWATALAGVVIADVTGIGFDDYVAQNIFTPLGMNSSTFAEPLPEALAPNMATGYHHEAGVMTPKPFEFVHNFGPAGSLSATAADMGRFMIAHLQNGRLGDKRILKKATAQLMHSRQFSPSPHINGAGLGFYETRINGRRLISHGGDTNYFHSDLNLLIDEGVGIFVSYSSASDLPIRSRGHLLRAFMDRYYPAKLPQLTPPQDFAARAAEYAGSYRMNRMSFTKNEKLFYSLGSTKVVPTADNTLMITGYLGPAVSQWSEIAPDTFRRVDSDDTFAFIRDAKGAVSHITFPLAFIAAFKLSWYDLIEFHGLVWILALIAAIGALVAAFRNRGTGDATVARARKTAAATGLLVVLSIAGIGASMATIASNPIAGFAGSFNIVLALVLLASVLTLLVAYFAIKTWFSDGLSGWGRIRYNLTAVAFLALVWSLNYFNLVGYHYG